MIFGTGVDVVEHSRISLVRGKSENRFIGRILTAEEISEYHKVKLKDQYLASRFASKEALGKALKTGLRNPVLFQNIIVVSSTLNAPVFQFAPALQTYLSDLSIRSVHLSISHEKSLSCAMVIAER
tara:strand:- start:439 stop:816 length:378 start_codon:yes stop_codon:yes gene_type:complete